LKSTLKDMLECLGNRRIALCRELTKTFEEFIRADIESAIALYEEKPPKGEYVIIIEGKQKQAGDEFKEFSVEELYEMYIGQGMNDKDALKAVAKDKGISKRDVYAKVKV
ncbi:MAG: 16S rRNA (cytidine(1402)-2'-O)-methyltransferase, partial [Clostridia bacterium]|nr:16S rRNA (cytidine(1402)-2'-O)-methyltransferase [Clostridia bacterium]